MASELNNRRHSRLLALLIPGCDHPPDDDALIYGQVVTRPSVSTRDESHHADPVRGQQTDFLAFDDRNEEVQQRRLKEHVVKRSHVHASPGQSLTGNGLAWVLRRVRAM